MAGPVDALLEAAADGVDSAWLSVTPENGRYAVSVGGERYEGLSRDGLRDVAGEHAESVAEWFFWERVAPGSEHGRAFLRWLEGAELSVAQRREALGAGRSRTWGQLRLRVELDGAGRRVYEVRHVDDADANAETLETHTDPADARHLGTYDEDGRYRPLSTAPTLQPGWVFPGLGAAELVRTVDFFYPATVANWYREREGKLDVSHWQETAQRQTGIYDVVGELEGEALEWVTEACCVDSQCLKRREWDEREGRELSTPRGDGAFPCREPCSLVIAAAREWAMLEREETRTYEFELTPAEKAQVETIVDAVADGRAGSVREADVGDGANRYRARFLRAKRFEDGRLPEPSGDE